MQVSVYMLSSHIPYESRGDDIKFFTIKLPDANFSDNSLWVKAFFGQDSKLSKAAENLLTERVMKDALHIYNQAQESLISFSNQRQTTPDYLRVYEMHFATLDRLASFHFNPEGNSVITYYYDDAARKLVDCFRQMELDTNVAGRLIQFSLDAQEKSERYYAK